MIEKKLQIINKLGLHARAAAVLVKTASAFSSEITIANDIKESNGKSIMGVMMLQATYGSEITVIVSGDDETEAMTAIETTVSDRFGEDE